MPNYKVWIQLQACPVDEHETDLEYVTIDVCDAGTFSSLSDAQRHVGRLLEKSQ